MTNDQGLKSNLVALDQAHAFDDDRVERRAAVAPDRRAADGFDDVHALNDSAKDRVLSVPLRVRRGADEELAGGAVRVVGHARHRNRAGDMLERLRKFALNFLLSRLPHAPGRRVAVDRVGVAALHCDDAVLDLDDAMKLRAVVKMIAHQVLEVGDVLRRVWYELDDDLAIAGVEHRDFIRVFLVTASRDDQQRNHQQPAQPQSIFHQTSVRSRISFKTLLTTCGLARPPLAFITWPTKKPISEVLPARYCSSCFGLAAIAASASRRISASSETCPPPIALTTSSAAPPPRYNSMTASFAILP